MSDADMYTPRRPRTDLELRYTSCWITRGHRDTVNGNDVVVFHAFLPHGASARDALIASHRLHSFAKRWIASARRKGFGECNQVAGEIPLSFRAPSIFDTFDPWSGTITGELELRSYVHARIGIFDAMGVPA